MKKTTISIPQINVNTMAITLFSSVNGPCINAKLKLIFYAVYIIIAKTVAHNYTTLQWSTTIIT